MKIHLLDEPDAEVVALEVQLGQIEGKFLSMLDGSVNYSHSAAPMQWKAGSSIDQFKLAVQAWEAYVTCARGASEQRQLHCVSDLKSIFVSLGVLNLGAHSYWAAIVEQTEHGLL